MKLSVVIPVHNGGENFQHCLAALKHSTRTPDEIIVVDDCSTDDSAELARATDARVIALSGAARGSAFARNRGAEQAHGDALVFLDADIAVHTDTLARIEKYLNEHPEIAALFGSYDDNPPARNVVSLYKNLQHHYVHQHARRAAATFWAGCGAIRRAVFAELCGFDERYARPSIEDIELGVRLRRAGHRVWLCPDVQVTHLKKWTLASWLRSDIFDRALPWSQLILRERNLPDDLNLDRKNRASALSAWGVAIFFIGGFFFPVTSALTIFSAIILVTLNFGFYFFLAARGGARFALIAIGLHWCYLLYSSLIFGGMILMRLLRLSHVDL